MAVDVYGHLVPGANRAAMDRLPTVEDMVEESLEETSGNALKTRGDESTPHITIRSPLDDVNIPLKQ